MAENKTPEYTRKAISNYRKTHKAVQVTFSLDELERLQKAGLTGKNIKPVIMAELEKREAQQK